MFGRILLCIVLSFSLSLSAQTLTTGTRTWNYLSGGIRVAPDSIWDEPADFPLNDQLIDLGFTFSAFGKDMDSVWLDQGGILSLDQEVWIGIWEDLCDKGFGARRPLSPISVKHSGSAGSKKVEIEWRNFGFYGDWEANGKCTDSANLRLTISENQTVELWFGPSVISHFNADFPKGVVVFADRLDSTGNAIGVDFKGDPASPQLVAVNETLHSTLNAWPQNGQVYTLDFKSSKITATKSRNAVYFSSGIVYLPKGHFQVSVFDMQGSIILSETTDHNYNLSDLSAGVYVVQITDGKQNQTIKIQL